MRRFVFVLVLVATLSSPAVADVSVFACEPEWAALAGEVGGERVRIFPATTALQDPHHIQARPSLIAKMRKADLVVCTGAGLEAGWLPLLLRKASNPRVQPGQPGYLEAVSAVTLLERPQRLDRAHGDLHGQGNPHIQTDPRNLTAVAERIADRLSAIDPDHASHYRGRLGDFLTRWQASIVRWEQSAQPLQGMKVVMQHNSWVYLVRWLGLEQVAVIEPKPGVPPASGDMARLSTQLEQQPADVIIRAAYQGDAGSKWLSGRTGIPVVVLPFTVGGSQAAGDLFALFDDTLRQLLGFVQ